MNFLRYTAKTLLLIRSTQKRILQQILPTHIQSLLWFNININTPSPTHTHEILYLIGSPDLSWGSKWKSHPEHDFPDTGYFLWIFWDSQSTQRHHICVSAEDMKGILYESSCKSINDFYFYNPRVLFDRIKRFIQADSILQRQNHPIIELLIKPTDSKPIPCLKLFQIHHGLEDCLYLQKNLSIAAIQWLYHWMTNGIHTIQHQPTLHLYPVTKIDYEFEEIDLQPNEFLFS